MTASTSPRAALRLVHGERRELEWSWFCGHCAGPSPRGEPPAPTARVCALCGFGLLLEAREDVAPSRRDAFVVVDAALLVQAMSRRAEQMLAFAEDLAVNRPVGELLVSADAEPDGAASFAGAIAEAVGGGDDPTHTFVRPWNTFGVRMRARIAACGPPRAALVVLETPPPQRLQAVQAS